MKHDLQRNVWPYSLIVVTLGLTAVSSIADVITPAIMCLLTLGSAMIGTLSEMLVPVHRNR